MTKVAHMMAGELTDAYNVGTYGQKVCKAGANGSVRKEQVINSKTHENKMRTKEITQYICDHCSKKYLRAHACLAHESMCYHNPENKTCCYSCKFLTKKETIVDENERTAIRRNLFFCDKKEVFLHPPQYKNSHYDLNEENETMPLECSEFQKPDINDPLW